MPRLYISPNFDGIDNGDGGIRRVVEAQKKYLPQLGFDLVSDVEACDLAAVHAGEWAHYDGPTVEHCHGLYWQEYEWANWAYELNRQVIAAMHKADAVTAPSEWVANILRRGMWLNPTVLYHGIDTDIWQPSVSHMEYVLWNKTRIDPVCNPEVVDVLASMNNDINYVSTYAQSGPNVKVTGVLPFTAAKPLIENAGVYLCSTRETFGIGTLEAMACGVPVVGWRWGGQREIIEQGVTGYLATPGDYADLLHGVEYCLANRQRIGEAARATVIDKFNWLTIMQQYADIYNMVLDARQRKHPKVSVIVTNYKLERYLVDCITSIVNAAGPKLSYEVVLVDDCSPTWSDDVAMELDRLAPGRSRVIHNETNQYLAGALNIGIDSAYGDYVLPIDADNMLAPNALGVLAGELDTHRDIDIAYGSMEVIDSEHWNGISGWPARTFSRELQLHHHNQVPSTAMYRKKVWATAGGYRRRCRTAEDADFWCRVTSLGFMPAKVTDAVTLIYRDRADSMSHINADWNWHNWYTWGRIPELTPFGAVQQQRPNIPTYEPVKVSVVIPVGPGHEHHVVDAVDSLVAQTFIQWECIVVNDTGHELPWIHPFVTVVNVDHTMDVGYVNRPARARNLGIAAASASVYVLLDADDYLAPNALAMFLHVYTTHKAMGTSFVYSDWFTQEDHVRHEAPNYDATTYLKRLPHPITGLYEKAIWSAIGGFDEALRGWEDWDFHLKQAEAGACGIRIPLPLLYYRINAGWRREQLYANEAVNKAEILHKWGEYIEGRRELMACGSCGGNIGVAPIPQYSPTNYKPDPTGETELVEYIGTNEGPLVYKGWSTGQQYRFGTDEGFRIKYVYKLDVPYFVDSFPDIFQKFVQGDEVVVLEAQGAPVRAMEEAGIA